MKPNNYRRIGWIMMTLIIIILPLQAQNTKKFSIELKNKSLPAALKLIEKEGGKNIIFSYNETESYRVTASIRQKTEIEAIATVLNGTPFICKEREEYFVIQKKGRESYATEIRGKIINEKNEPLAYSNVLLLTAGDSTFVNGCVTREDGSFLMIAKEGISYLLKISYIGYQTKIQAYHSDQTLHLTPDTQLMQEVTITARRPMIEAKTNGLKAHVAGTSLAQMGTAAEMLSHLPFVTPSNEGYTVLGHGVPIIYINNRKVQDATELERLRANEILSAEIITTPGVEYASDVAAVIRIRTIRQHGQGLSGNFNTTYSQGHSPNASEQLSLNYRTGGLDVFIKGHMTQRNSYGKTTNLNHIKGSAIWETTKSDLQTGKGTNFSGELGFNYEPDEHHSLGIRYIPEASIGDLTKYSEGETVTTRNGEEYDKNHFVQSTQEKRGWNQAVNAYYTGELGNWKIDFNADYLYKRSHSGQDADNNGENAAQSDSRARNRLYAAKLIINTRLGKGQVSFGTEETFTNRHDIFTQDGFSTDADNHIKQSIYSIFTDYSISLHKWRLSAGLRYEHQQMNYYEYGIKKEEQSPTYNDLIPVINASWSNHHTNVSLSYRMQKKNPSYSLLSNSLDYRSKYEYVQGNPLLQPQKSHVLSLSAAWKWLYVTAAYNRINNTFTNMIMPYNDSTHPGVLLFTTVTIPTADAYTIYVNASPKLGCWQPQFTGGASIYCPNSEEIGITGSDRVEPLFYFNLDNSFNLSKGWFFNLQAQLQTAANQKYIIYNTEGQVSARLSKSFLNETLNIALTANDILHTGYYHFNLYGINAYMENRIYRDFQRFGLQVSYKFNATKSKYKGTGAGQSEKKRL